jgi:hypothetical protein
MKCLKHILTNEVIRVSDDKAASIRAADNLEPKCWQYCPKHEWKNYRAQRAAWGNAA